MQWYATLCVLLLLQFLTGDGKRLVVVHLGFSKHETLAKNSVLTCIALFIGPIN